MNKKLAHIIALFGDLLCLGGLWIGCQEFQRILMEVANQTEMIRFGNRIGFFIFGLGFPLIHLLSIIGYFWPNFLKKIDSLVTKCIVIFVIMLFAGGVMGSYWIQAQVQKAGYIYCRKASGVSALAKSVVYTKNMEICEELAASKKKR